LPGVRKFIVQLESDFSLDYGQTFFFTLRKYVLVNAKLGRYFCMNFCVTRDMHYTRRQGVETENKVSLKSKYMQSSW
jgi:hypothetical protein